MTGWHQKRPLDMPARAVIVTTLLALLLVAVVPVALLVAVIMMVLGHLVGGLAVFGSVLLAAAIAVALAGMSGKRHLRNLLSGGGFRVERPDAGQHTNIAEPAGSDYTNVVRLDRSEYTEVR